MLARPVRMSGDIPFDRSFDLPPETVEEVVPGVRRLLANNPGPFTFKGTGSYIVGRGRVAIIDPGPLDETHIAALLDAVREETVTHIFVTHTHRDHSPAVPRVKAATGALVLAEGRELDEHRFRRVRPGELEFDARASRRAGVAINDGRGCDVGVQDVGEPPGREVFDFDRQAHASVLLAAREQTVEQQAPPTPLTDPVIPES